MAVEEAILNAETFRFFRDLGKNNSKVWMDQNRERYKQLVVAPFRRLLDALTPAAQKLYPEFCVSGRTGENFSRINRDIRFAKDKTPYYTHMYLYLSCADAQEHPGGQLYVGVSAQARTMGFRIYHEGRESAIACVCRPRAPWRISLGLPVRGKGLAENSRATGTLPRKASGRSIRAGLLMRRNGK